MKQIEEISDMLRELGDELFTVYSLSNILITCQNFDEEFKKADILVLMDILLEKNILMKNKFNDLEIFINRTLSSTI